ncbi:tRNA glutamyl-Q(34) synthetase GluQRS [Falsirhodobacter halotolerans]|uniref:tRNA glutamyl-Q(34) synthetase GluQRS n=1 Tax=Falsirhodobacter halotolerans TaxID=1146892 RepID=UPI001FD62BA2|nr:tRNA glutamyl-Q(34) synthetase GluQRS [Falsirhodobacter halotolerans]MCJ8139736.1 tRNA glutamyl-Q(34) synthetase GluQRS [Falsirhodobacter halotolerans]
MAGPVTRFAPSPTGPLHLGHAFSALTVWDRAQGGAALLRIEDMDQSRARPEWEAQIYDDLAWLGLDWPRPVMRQSDRSTAYDVALATLAPFTYPCRCTRADIRAALSAPQEGAMGPDGLIYPGTCRHRTWDEAGPDDATRLDMGRAMAAVASLSFVETGMNAGEHRFDARHMIRQVGDVILARRGMGAAYHLAVVVDDAAQGVTEAVRGADLAEATPIHVLLARLLDLPPVAFHHHRLIRDDHGRRLAKRDDARAIATFRAEGATPADIRRMVGL